MRLYRQKKDLPFARKGSIWKIEGDKLIVNEDDYSYCSPRLWSGLVDYYTNEDTGQVEMSPEWFEEMIYCDKCGQGIVEKEKVVDRREQKTTYTIPGFEDAEKQFDELMERSGLKSRQKEDAIA